MSDRFEGVQQHAGLEGVHAAVAAVDGHDGLVALGGGSAIDTAKAVSAATGLPLVAIPTTFGGAEWTPYFGSHDRASGVRVAGTGSDTRAIVYEPELTLDLPWAESCGTAMNALAHCTEGLFVGECEDAWIRARLIDEWLPRVNVNPHDLEARRNLLRGAEHAGRALATMGRARSRGRCGRGARTSEGQPAPSLAGGDCHASAERLVTPREDHAA